MVGVAVVDLDLQHSRKLELCLKVEEVDLRICQRLRAVAVL